MRIIHIDAEPHTSTTLPYPKPYTSEFGMGVKTLTTLHVRGLAYAGVFMCRDLF
jgi:hypothetical protein